VNKRVTRACEFIANKYEKHGEIIEFEEGDYYIIKIFKKNKFNNIIIIYILARVFWYCKNNYKLQTKYGILRLKYKA
jgi:hypothetical protein